jgi:nitrogen fixation protein NifB
MTIDVSQHPCFNGSCSLTRGRVHLPVAPKCNVQCNFCSRRYDCINESRPGVSSALLSPGQAVHYLRQVMQARPETAVVGIAGPGDPFASPQLTLETLRRVRKHWPDMLLCVASNGLNVAPFVHELAELELTHLTITVSAVDPGIGGRIYSWIRPGTRPYRGEEAGRRMLEAQTEAIRAAKEQGIIVKINTIVIPGVNQDHVLDVAHHVRELGADLLNLMPLCRVPGTPFENVPAPADGEIKLLQDAAADILPQMRHCTRCRSDAVGLLGEDLAEDLRVQLARASRMPLEPADERPCVAVATREGMLVNQHLGEARSLKVYRRRAGGFAEVADVPAPPAGGGTDRWRELGKRLSECSTVLCSGVGNSPREALRGMGIQVVETEGLILEVLDALYRGERIEGPRRPHACGSSCAGRGDGCG